MKYPTSLLVGVCLLISSAPVTADQAEGEVAIRKVFEQLVQTYNNRDAEAYAALCTEDIEDWEGTVRGRAVLVKTYEAMFEQQANVKVKIIDEIGIIFVTQDVAIYKPRVEFSGGIDQDGKPLPPRKMLTAQIFVKKDGQWLRAAVFMRPVQN